MNEKQRILDMVEQGKITAKEAMELLEALDATETPKQTPAVRKLRQFKTLRIIVIAEKDGTNVNINVPLTLVRVLGGIAKDYNKFIPNEAKKHMSEQGVDLSAIDIEGILRALEEGTLDNPDLVNIDVNNSQDGIVKVRIFLDEN